MLSEYMAEMNKENFEKTFEQQWQEAFESAELSPKTDLWDKIDAQLAVPTLSVEAGRYGYLFSVCFLMLLSGFFVQKTVPNKPQKLIALQAQASILADLQNAQTQESRTLPARTAVGQESTRTLPTRTAFGQESTRTLPARTAVGQESTRTLPTRTALGQESTRTLPARTARGAGKVGVDSASQPLQPTKMQGGFIKRATEGLRQRIQQLIHPEAKENAVEGLVPLSLRLSMLKEPAFKEVPNVAIQPLEPMPIRVQKFWVGVQRGVTFSPTKLDIQYGKYLNDYAKVHQLTDGVKLNDFFTEVYHKNNYSIANQGDIRFGYHFSARWQFIAGIQYRVEFLEQSTNAFFVNYYDYSRHSFLLDILEGNIQSPAFAQALQNHPTYNPLNENNFTISQFNQQDLINISSRFQYIGIPLQVGYTLHLFKKVGFTLLASAQVDKLTSSNTVSHELKDDVAITYDPKTTSKISTWSWQMGGGVQAEYRYDKHWALTANSMLFQNIKPIKENKYVAVRPRGLLVNLGAAYTF